MATTSFILSRSHGKDYGWIKTGLVHLMADQRQSIANTLEDKSQARRERDRARRNSLTAEQKEVINARRRTARQNKVVNEEERREENERRRTSRQAKHNSLTDKQKEENNACRRATRQNKTLDERNAQQRASRNNITGDERATLLAKRKANAATKRNTVCAESLAMPCPNATNLTKISSTSTPEYTIRTEGNTSIFTHFIYLIIILTLSRML